jgi:hypothetical protein
MRRRGDNNYYNNNNNLNTENTENTQNTEEPVFVRELRSKKKDLYDESDNKFDNKFNSAFTNAVGSYAGSQILQSGINAISTVLNKVFNNVAGKVSEIEFLHKDNNRGLFLVAGSVLCCFFMMSILWQFIFTFSLLYCSAKVMLWFLEHYKPDDSDDIITDKYVSETSPVDIMEYLVSLMIVTGFSFVSYVPGLNFIVNVLCVLISITSISSKDFRRQLCTLFRNTLVSQDYDTNSLKEKEMGKEGLFHSTLQKFCFAVETLNIGTYNLTKNSRSVYSELRSSASYSDGLKTIFRKVSISDKDQDQKSDQKSDRDQSSDNNNNNANNYNSNNYNSNKMHREPIIEDVD